MGEPWGGKEEKKKKKKKEERSRSFMDGHVPQNRPKRRNKHI